MKCYVIQFHVHNWAPWEVCPGREYDTLEEAKAALFAWLLPALISASLRKAGREGLKEIRRQVVWLKKMGKTGKKSRN